jgi:hypothetical protein
MQVLRNNSLGLYEEAFAHNCVDGQTLTVSGLTQALMRSDSFVQHYSYSNVGPAEKNTHRLPTLLRSTR